MRRAALERGAGRRSPGHDADPRWRPVRCALFALLLILFSSGSLFAAGSPRVLILTSDPHTAPGLVDLELSFRRALADTVHSDADIDVEHLDLVYNTSPELRNTLATLLQAKYEGRQPRVVVVLSLAVLRFVLAERPRLFPHATVLFGHLERADVAQLQPLENVAGVFNAWKLSGELDTALQLLPRTRRAVVIMGNGPFERLYEDPLRREFARFTGRVELDWWVGLPMAELESRIAKLPPRTVVVYFAIYRDSAGGSYIPILALERLARRTNSPIFALPAHFVGHGVVGDGHMSFAVLGAQLGTAASRLLRGETAQAIGFTSLQPSHRLFDGRQLDRWGIPRRRLPAGSSVAFEEESVWQRHKTMLLTGLAIMVLQALLLTGVLAERQARRRAERTGQESEQLHKSVLDSLDERVATIARDGTIVAANRAWIDFAETQAAGVPLGIGANYLAAVKRAVERGQDDARRTLESLTAVLSSRDGSRRLAYFSPGDNDGWRYEMRIMSLQRADGGAIVMIQDVTDRWKAEERVRVTLESLPVATILLDEGRRIELVNAEAERLFGYHRGEVLGRSLRLLFPDFERGVRRLPSPEQPAESGDAVAEYNLTGRRSDGGEVFVQLHLRTIVMGTRSLVLASISDLTDRRRADAEVQRLREETAHFGRVAAVGEMSAAIAHELNQPLTGIMTNCQAAQLSIEHGSLTREDVAETFSDIVADARRAGEVIHRLRLMLRKAPAEARALDLNDTVQVVHRLVAHDLALRGTALDLELTEDLPLVTGDRIHLQQVILNLVFNGADAMAGLPVERRRMRLRTIPGMDHTVELELRDSGPGMAPEVMSRVFEPFFTTKPNGMGMGLSIVRSIVETHGGRITCANAASGGAVFTVVLPAAQEKEAA